MIRVIGSAIGPAIGSVIGFGIGVIGPALVIAIALAPSPAAADCAATCGDVCYAPDGSAFFRAEVLATSDGFTSRIRIVERFGGAPTVGDVIGDELDGQSQVQVVAGDSVFVTLARYADTGELHARLAWPIRGGNVICDSHDPEVPLETYVAMATSNTCERTATELDISNTCDDTVGPGCSSTQAHGGSLVMSLGLLGLVSVWQAARSRSRSQSRSRSKPSRSPLPAHPRSVAARR